MFRFGFYTIVYSEQNKNWELRIEFRYDWIFSKRGPGGVPFIVLGIHSTFAKALQELVLRQKNEK